MKEHSIEWYITMGDAWEACNEELQAIPSETHILTSQDLDDWYQQLGNNATTN